METAEEAVLRDITLQANASSVPWWDLCRDCCLASSRIPEPPVLGSIGDFALEIDRMKLLEKKSELIGSVLKGDTITYGSSDCAGKGDAVEERRIVGHSVHRAREKLERKLHQLHQNGIICHGTPSKHLKIKLLARKQRSELRAVRSMRW